jgi:hypothetical protein
MNQYCYFDHYDRDDWERGCPLCGDKDSQVDYCWQLYGEFMSVEAYYQEETWSKPKPITKPRRQR